jgi:pimeloyl-ACP methyl ester carboxylesterase
LPLTRSAETPAGLAYDRAGPRDDLPVLLLHAGIADRRMWHPQWAALTARHDAVRMDLRGFGESTERPPPGETSAVDDVIDTLTAIDVGRSHVVGASFGAGIAVELALTRPDLVASILLSAPGGSLISEVTPDLRAFFDAERAALADDDLDAAVDANLMWWVDGPRRPVGTVDPTVRDLVAQMQRLAFEITADWDDVEDAELHPPPLERLQEIQVPTLILVGAFDLDAIQDTAQRVTDGIGGARRVDWPDVAHLPSMERPDDFLALLDTWLAEAGTGGS